MTCQHTEGPYHDCAYVDQRNALLQQAERRAEDALGPPPEDVPRRRRLAWQREYDALRAAELRRLLEIAGLPL